ncbi:MAG: superoxide dismutase [Candidatus Marinimicrobia bacterium]|jgi:Fe-Mn family superoxide dismutase|nr:superoxide dismutase [Candidatus Neomarinimicrobiota bacterium]MDP6592600.1 superoxide dismutase [Candidatus Neomarinimicrobiota bacterium]MDP6836669.1 superoxide dismutase [Candidatus Neomarinimicrobiota bacterium]|tara:strand:+ start:16675 stop:17256 length:582 start_codon:yes stop_codon:yes gene_type:complete
MEHRLPDLPYEKDSLEPHISSETLEYHHGKHHNTYVQNLNKLIQGTEFEDQDLDEIVANATGGLFNNAAQHWNHSFYWDCMSPNGGGEPSGTLAQAINGAFGSFDEFKDLFSNTAITTFGSGWAWLVSNDGGNLQIVSAKNAENPISSGQTPLLTCDVWEHAYYVDYRNARPKYVEAFWNVINWDFVIEKLES